MGCSSIAFCGMMCLHLQEEEARRQAGGAQFGGFPGGFPGILFLSTNI